MRRVNWPRALLCALWASSLHSGSQGAGLQGPLRLNCGSDSTIVFEGHTWEADAYYSDGIAVNASDGVQGFPAAESSGVAVAEIFLTRRVFLPSGTGGCYRLPLEPSRYTLRLSFAPPDLSSCDRDGSAAATRGEASAAENSNGRAHSSSNSLATEEVVGMKDEGGEGGGSPPPLSVGPTGGTADAAAASKAWIAVSVGGQQMEIVRIDQHLKHVYRTEYTVDSPAWPAAGLPGAANPGPQSEANATSPKLSLCFGALQGTAFVSTIEVLPVPQGLYTGVYGDAGKPRGVLASRDRLAAGATLEAAPEDVADRVWHLGSATWAGGATTQDLSCFPGPGDEAPANGSNPAVGGSKVQLGAGSSKDATAGSGGDGSPPPQWNTHVDSGRHVVECAGPVEGAMQAPFFLPPSLLSMAFEASAAMHRLHLEWHFHPVSRKNPWLLVLAFLEPTSTAVVGDRVFDVLVNGETVVQRFDILALPAASPLLKVQTSGKDPSSGMAGNKAEAVPLAGSKSEYRLGSAGPGEAPHSAVQAVSQGGASTGSSGAVAGGRKTTPGGKGSRPPGKVAEGRGALRYVVVTVWNRRPSFLRALPTLEVDLVRAPGSLLEPALCLMEVFEVFKGISTIKASTHIGGGESDGATDSPVPVETESEPFAAPEDSSGSHGGVIAAAVIASVGGATLIVSVAFLGILWRRHSQRREERIRQARAARSALASQTPSQEADLGSEESAGAASSVPGASASPENPVRALLGNLPRESSAQLRPSEGSLSLRWIPGGLSEIEEEPGETGAPGEDAASPGLQPLRGAGEAERMREVEMRVTTEAGTSAASAVDNRNNSSLIEAEDVP